MEIENNLERPKDPLERNILYVEDQSEAFTLIKIFLKKMYNLIWAQDPQEVAQILETQKIDMILMDISLREKDDGFDFAVNLKQDKRYSHIPIIALTAHAMKGDRERFLNGGLNEHITKPVMKGELIRKVNEFF